MKKRQHGKMIVITITVGNKSFVEKIPEHQTRAKIDPQFYREIRFRFDSRESLENYRDHFIYGYLESLVKNGILPDFILNADAADIGVSWEKE